MSTSSTSGRSGIPLIGLCGLIGAGKSAVAAHLEARHGYARCAFADAIKQVAREAFGWDGEKDARGRRLLQALGTEAGRAYDPDIWTRKLFHRVDAILAGATGTYELRRPPGIPGPETAHLIEGARGGVVIEDVRFPNEGEAIRDRGGVLVLVIRPKIDTDTGWHVEHDSERMAAGLTIRTWRDRKLDGWHVVTNDGTLADLAAKVDAVIAAQMPQEAPHG